MTRKEKPKIACSILVSKLVARKTDFKGSGFQDGRRMEEGC
jgi:hypothetical protein